nr:hypothetical protein [Granulosicoccus sp.]
IKFLTPWESPNTVDFSCGSALQVAMMYIYIVTATPLEKPSIAPAYENHSDAHTEPALIKSWPKCTSALTSCCYCWCTINTNIQIGEYILLLSPIRPPCSQLLLSFCISFLAVLIEDGLAAPVGDTGYQAGIR